MRMDKLLAMTLKCQFFKIFNIDMIYHFLNRYYLFVKINLFSKKYSQYVREQIFRNIPGTFLVAHHYVAI
jgi:hypothetical protein